MTFTKGEPCPTLPCTLVMTVASTWELQTKEVSGATSIIYAIINPRNGVALATKDLSDGITVVASVVTVTLVPADTEGLLGGTYLHELEIITSDNKTYTALQGEIILKKGYITHE
jgi:hypothetical protein